ncbi:unnamed protein product [Vitrella brassicaformis CCMP3155]|uniref:Uncharacterized protein n=2 Tax=Vitrella brassicaformis TaxID=1169539 RepID=A0A0G4EMR7_VITBC|nr:unnamed protein product [Vitrella brassicaformis CCMP3155]|eukprot:CEL98275.1 unnamed protein product [Vitrella brassicaformis CCMP3155]
MEGVQGCAWLHALIVAVLGTVPLLLHTGHAMMRPPRVSGLGGAFSLPHLFRKQTEADDSPHPLRMEEWKLRVRRGLFRRRSEMRINFRRDGSLQTSDGHKGEWRLDKFGVMWEFLVDNTTHRYMAEVHWNVFGSQPRMYKGVITRDRRAPIRADLFRPVIGTFTGIGCGTDTADVSYRDRT